MCRWYTHRSLYLCSTNTLTQVSCSYHSFTSTNCEHKQPNRNVRGAEGDSLPLFPRGRPCSHQQRQWQLTEEPPLAPTADLNLTWLVYWLSTFLLYNYFFVAEERKRKWLHILICGEAVKQPFPLTNGEFHRSHVMNGNNLPVDNNFVMEWTFLLTMCLEYLVSSERVINSNRSPLTRGERRL